MQRDQKSNPLRGTQGETSENDDRNIRKIVSVNSSISFNLKFNEKRVEFHDKIHSIILVNFKFKLTFFVDSGHLI